MTLPQPRHLAICEVPYERKWLWVVHDHRITVVEIKSQRVFRDNPLVDRFFAFRQRNMFSLQRVVKLLCTSEEIRRALYQVPAGLDPDGIHHQRQRRQDLADASAIKRRAEMN